MLEPTLNPHNYESIERFQAMVKKLEDASRAGDGKAALELAYLLCPDSERVLPLPKGVPEISQEKWLELSARAVELLSQEAANGDGQAMHYIAQFYQSGQPPIEYDWNKFFKWTQKSYEAGYIFAANDLYPLLADPKSEFFDAEKAREVGITLKKSGQCVIFLPSAE